MSAEVYYFGCWGPEKGHFWFLTRGRCIYREPGGMPRSLTSRIDCGLCPNTPPPDDPYGNAGPQNQGEALLHHIEGWTVLAFWDRTVDHRGNSNSAFVVRGDYDFDAMLGVMRERFPEIAARLDAAGVEVRLAPGSGGRPT